MCSHIKIPQRLSLPAHLFPPQIHRKTVFQLFEVDIFIMAPSQICQFGKKSLNRIYLEAHLLWTLTKPKLFFLIFCHHLPVSKSTWLMETKINPALLLRLEGGVEVEELPHSGAILWMLSKPFSLLLKSSYFLACLIFLSFLNCFCFHPPSSFFLTLDVKHSSFIIPTAMCQARCLTD